MTGACGFIGSNLVDALIDGNDCGVIGADSLVAGSWEYRNPAAEYRIGDIRDRELMIDLIKDVDIVFHLAALPRVQKSIDDAMGTNDVNIGGTLNILEAIRRVNPVCRIVYSSSSSVYGIQDEPQMTEEMPCNPLSPYALQKFTAEAYCRMYRRLFDLDVVCLRYFNVYGPRQVMDGPYSLVIGRFMQLKREGKLLTIYGDGKQTRAYTHVTDIVRANLLSMAYEQRADVEPVFNIGTNVEVDVNRIAELVGGEVVHIIPNPRGDMEERRKFADFEKARIYLGWEPSVSVEDGVAKLIGENRG